MTIRNLDRMFCPESVALIGASPAPGSVGYTLAKNMVQDGFRSRTFFVNPKHNAILGLRCCASIGEIPEVPELTGNVLATNSKMIEMAKKLGFSARHVAEDNSLVEVVLDLQMSTQAIQ